MKLAAGPRHQYGASAVAVAAVAAAAVAAPTISYLILSALAPLINKSSAQPRMCAQRQPDFSVRTLGVVMTTVQRAPT